MKKNVFKINAPIKKKLTLVLAITAQFSEKVGQGRHKYQSITIVVIFLSFPWGSKHFGPSVMHACGHFESLYGKKTSHCIQKQASSPTGQVTIVYKK